MCKLEHTQQNGDKVGKAGTVHIGKQVTMLMGRRLHLRGLGPLQSLQARKSYEIVWLFLTHAHCVVNESKFVIYDN